MLVALTIPARTRIDAAGFATKAGEIVRAFAQREAHRTPAKTEDHHDELWELEEISERAQAPMLRFEHALQPWVAFVVVPIFALANAGITVAVLLALRFGLASLPHGVTLAHIYGAAWLGGIGFTMSIFIADLAFAAETSLALAKLGALIASAIAGAGGYIVLRRTTRAADARR